MYIFRLFMRSQSKNGVKMSSPEAFSVCVLFILFARTNGLCQYAGSNPTINSCEEIKSGQKVFVDFQKINRSCTCIVKSFFTGDLLVQVSSVTKIYHQCEEKVVASSRDKIVQFTCDMTFPASNTFSVEANDTSVKVTVEYKAGFSLENFYPCLHVKENIIAENNTDGTVSVICGNLTTSTTTESTTSSTTTTSRTTTSTTTATSSPSKPDTTTILSATPPPSSSTNIIAGAAAGALVLVVVLIVLVAIIVLRKKKGRKNKETQKTNEASEHTNRAFDENNCGLPDNPLYHSAQLIDEVGYSSVQKNQLGLPPTEETNKKQNDPYYDVPTNNKPINNSDTSPAPIYAVPNKSGASPPKENEPQAMYAQVSKPSKSSTKVPMQSINQDGLVYLEVENDATSANKNSPYTKNENKDGVSYAEIKRN